MTEMLEGATAPGPENAYPSNAGEFAAQFNSWTTERREQWLDRVIQASREAITCFTQMHADHIAGLAADNEALRARLHGPEIVCLCGSTRFYDEFQEANYDLTMAGKIVLSVGFYPHAKAKHGHGEGVGHDSTEKVALDELHKRKIDLADRVLVLNVGGYIGESTRSEIAYAEAHGKRIDYLVGPRTVVPEGEQA